MNSLCYVTTFYDIGRDDWTSFRRTFDTYLKDFSPFVPLMAKADPTKHRMIVFIDKKHYDAVFDITRSVKNILLIRIDEEFMKSQIYAWRTIENEEKVMLSEEYRRLIPHRTTFPENSNPKYTLINHSKIDFVNIAMKMCDFSYFCWVDFGYFGDKKTIPNSLIDVSKLDVKTVNYTLINPLTEADRDVIYTLKIAPEKIGGFFFFGHRNVLKIYQEVYHKVHQELQSLGIVDDDQHIALRCYFSHPDLFTLHYLGGWHRALLHFQEKKYSIVIWVDDTEIFLTQSIVFLSKFLDSSVQNVYVLLPEKDIKYISEYSKLSDLKISYVSQKETDSFSISFLIDTEVYLLLKETYILKSFLSVSELYEKDKLVCTLESFPHGMLDYTTNRYEWYRAYDVLGIEKGPLMYENRCMTISPQLLHTETVRTILCHYRVCSIPIYWFFIQKQGLDKNYVESKTLWNKELSHNAMDISVPGEYLGSNIRNGYSNESKFMIVKGWFNYLYKFIPISVENTKEILDELRIYRVEFGFVRLGEDKDGGYVICDLGVSGVSQGVLYSYGVGNTHKFETDFVKKYGSLCYMYDHTVDVTVADPRIQHLKLGVDYYTHPGFSTVEEEIKKNGHWENRNLTLKMDVEGYEWLSLLMMTEECLMHFRQIVIELHWLDTDMNAVSRQKINVLRKLNKSFVLAHIHPVNCQNLVVRGDFVLPPVVECTFLRKDLCPSAEIIRKPCLPHALDRPMDLALREIRLSDFYPWNDISTPLV